MKIQEARRILLYSHDSYGLGHLRRTVTLASELVQRIPSCTALIVTGSPVATRFPLPAGVDVLKLPSVTKDAAGRYVSRSLGLDLETLIELRSRLILQALEVQRPDLVVVDHKPIGMDGELLPTLERARSLGIRTILGLRDIIDAPEVVAREWSKSEVRHALAHLYDRICVYGDPLVFDARAEYTLPPELGPRLQFTGYVARPGSRLGFRPLPSARPHVLVTVGGGEDGSERIDAYLECVEANPGAWSSTLVLGPLFDRGQGRAVRHRAQSLPDVRVHRTYDDMPGLLEESHAVVAMAGYNTAVEVLQSRTPAVFLPRTHPRLEQWLRSSRLARLGLAEHLEDWSPEAMGAAIRRAVSVRRATGPMPDLSGRERFAKLAADLLEAQFTGEHPLPAACQ